MDDNEACVEQEKIKPEWTRGLIPLKGVHGYVSDSQVLSNANNFRFLWCRT